MKFIEWVFGCSHKRTTFPLTRNQKGTYVVCVDCGKEFGYNWAKMEVCRSAPLEHSLMAPIIQILLCLVISIAVLVGTMNAIERWLYIAPDAKPLFRNSQQFIPTSTPSISGTLKTVPSSPCSFISPGLR